MSSQQANPVKTSKYVITIALVGASGNLGSHILSALLAKGKASVTVLTRSESTAVFPTAVKVEKIDYSSHVSLVTALKGVEVLIITMAVSAPPGQEDALIRAAADAGVRYIFPNQWGQDFANPLLVQDVFFLGPKLIATQQLISSLGMDWLVVISGFWYEYSLAGTEWRYGFDFKERKVTFYGDGNVKVNTSTWPQIGRAVAALLALPQSPADGEDKTMSVLERFKNKECYISSFLLSQRDMFASALRVTGTKEEDWSINYEDAEARYARGKGMLEKGEMVGFGLGMYARSFFNDGVGDYETVKGLSNELLGLPVEDLDVCTRGAVERAVKFAGTY